MSKKNKFYITTPIYYVNAAPHIGHSYTCIAADTLARFKRNDLGKNNVWFLTGTDEHGQKIQKAADEAKLTCQEYVDKVVVQFKGLWTKLNISYDDFIRTTESRHIKVLEQVLNILFNNGDIYQSKYEGWYCTPCESFFPDTQVENKLCPDCLRPIERISEVNYFFKLKKYQQDLIKHIEDNPDFVQPNYRRNEVLSFLKLNELNDLCISRPKERLNWGIPLPFAKDHVTYVWFDALVNYISAVGSFNEKNIYESNWWKDDVEIVHLIGKDILRHHAVYWPIMLKALGIRLPTTIFAHGWWMMGEDKMSKSRGNVINPLDMIEKYGLEVYRYFLLRDVPFGLDGNFSEASIVKRFNSDLANDLGNLVYRTLTMIEKYYSGQVPSQGNLDAQGKVITDKIKSLAAEVKTCVDAFNLNMALENIWGLIAMSNKYVEETKPWNLAKEGKSDELKSFIRLLVDSLREVALVISPFLPQTSQSITEQLGQDVINKANPLFPRIDTKKA